MDEPLYIATPDMCCWQARRDDATRAQLSRKTANKMARADLIEAQRQALLQEMQHIRKDILQQESWLRVPLPPLPCPALALLTALCTCRACMLYGCCKCGHGMVAS